MRYACFAAAVATRTARRRGVPAAFGVILLWGLAACNGTSVVTLTSTASPDRFLTYRVGLVSVQLQTSNGSTTSTLLPSSTTVDLAQLVDLCEVVGAAAVAHGNFTQALITLDYGSAQILYDDGSVGGIALAPVGASGRALGQVKLTLDLDPSNDLGITSRSAARLSLDFNLAASNLINLTQKTVTVSPLIAASASPIDTKVVRVRGPLAAVNTASGVFTTGIVPFDFATVGAGQLQITSTTGTTYEINGVPSVGTVGLTQLASLNSGVMTEAFGTLSSTTAISTTNLSSVSFAATQVLAGSSVQGSGFDRISGIVSGRSGNTLTVEDATLVANDGINTFVPGTAIINMGANSQVTQFGSGSIEFNGLQQISVGSRIDAFGAASTSGSGNVTLDASAGRARLAQTSASGLVTVQGTGALTLNLASLGGRSASTFDFVGTGTSFGFDASASAYQVATGSLDLTNSIVGSPVEGFGLVTAFGAAPPDFTATTLLDSTTINALLVLDWGTGTPAPFTSYNSSQIDIDARNRSIGARHEIEVGAQTINIVGIASDPLIVPNGAATNTVFAIGHAASGRIENFVTFAAFIAQLQKELSGAVLATGITALGPYSTTTHTLSASSMTLFLNN